MSKKANTSAPPPAQRWVKPQALLPGMWRWQLPNRQLALGRHLATIAAGGVFGEMALIDHQPRSASAVAKTDCRVAAVPERRLTLRCWCRRTRSSRCN